MKQTASILPISLPHQEVFHKIALCFKPMQARKTNRRLCLKRAKGLAMRPHVIERPVSLPHGETGAKSP